MIQHDFKPKLYFTWTFLVTYAFWFAGAYVSFQNESGLHMLLMLPGLIAPFVISQIMVSRSNDPELKRDYRNRLLNPRLIQPKLLPALIFLMPLVVLVSTAVSLLFGGSVSQFRIAEEFSFTSGFVPVLLLLLLAATFEELGWRGYAFDSLESRNTYLKASIIFGILWSLWHFPLVFANDSYQYKIWQENVWYAANFFVSVVPMGVIISWFCIKNGKSIIAAILFHFMINISQEMLNISQFTKCIETVVLSLVVVALVVIDREMFFSKGLLAQRGK